MEKSIKPAKSGMMSVNLVTSSGTLQRTRRDKTTATVPAQTMSLLLL